MIAINLTSVLVNDQKEALTFYTDVVGFEKKTDLSLGDVRWLTVVSPDGPEGVELLLEPTEFQPAKTYQKSLFDARIPYSSFTVDDIQKEYKRLRDRGVMFSMEPTSANGLTVAVFDDTCGNLIQLVQL